LASHSNKVSLLFDGGGSVYLGKYIGAVSLLLRQLRAPMHRRRCLLIVWLDWVRLTVYFTAATPGCTNNISVYCKVIVGGQNFEW